MDSLHLDSARNNAPVLLNCGSWSRPSWSGSVWRQEVLCSAELTHSIPELADAVLVDGK